MTELITIEEAREHLRLDADSGGGPDDGWLSIFIPAVSEAVALWLKESWRLYEPTRDTDDNVILDSDGNPVPVLDSDGEPVVRWVVKAACLVELEGQYRYRAGEGNVAVPQAAGQGYVLGKAATALLSAIRRPTVV